MRGKLSEIKRGDYELRFIDLNLSEVERKGDMLTFIIDKRSISNEGTYTYTEESMKYSLRLVTQNEIEGKWVLEQLYVPQDVKHFGVTQNGEVGMVRIRE
jgi:hypothetical protein